MVTTSWGRCNSHSSGSDLHHYTCTKSIKRTGTKETLREAHYYHEKDGEMSMKAVNQIKALTHMSLFSGIGGIDLAAEWAGFETIGQCEFADYPTKVLEKHWPDVPRWRDIRDVTAESFRERTGRATVDLVSGGFPCQPFSVAGKQKGKEDERYLWPEMLRVITQLNPTWVLGENVPGILSIAGDDVCKDLERIGYEVGIFNYEAAAIGAPHRRARIFFVAYSKSKRLQRDWPTGKQITGARLQQEEFKGNGNDVADTDNRSRLVRGDREFSTVNKTERARANFGGGTPEHVARQWWSVEPDVGRVANGIPSRVDRLKCLGNAVVPQQIYPVLWAIAQLETNERTCNYASDKF